MRHFQYRPVAAGRFAARFGMGVIAASPAAAGSVRLSTAPAEWTRYAGYAATTIAEWMEAESEIAERLRAHLDTIRPMPDRATAPILLKLWIDRDGTVSRIDFPPFACPEANMDLRALIMHRRLSVVPPQEMPRPFRIAMALRPVPLPDEEERAIVPEWRENGLLALQARYDSVIHASHAGASGDALQTARADAALLPDSQFKD